MYDQGNFGPPTAQGPYTSSSMFHQQHPAVSLPPFSQGSQPPRTTFMQHRPPPFPSPVAQLGHPSYEHTSVLHQLGPPLTVPSSGVNSRPYLTTTASSPLPTQPLQVHANSQIPQNSQWLQNANFVPQPVPSVAPMVLPPPPSQGQTVYGSPLQQPPSTGVQAHQQAHEPASSFFTSPQFGAFWQPQNSNMPVARPPPPTSPPVALPHPPSSPPPTSSFPFSNDSPRPNPAVSHSTSHAQNTSGTDTPVGSTDGVSRSYLVGNDACKPEGFGKGNGYGDSASKISSSCMKNSIPPPKPLDDRTVRSIEILCQFIAKNGPEFEDMTRKKEFGNPQFKFLFGGEPGSENSVAYEYFMWMKNKCKLEFKTNGAQKITDSPVRPLAGYSSQLNADTGVPSSSADSDMDMEDDITHPNEELLIHPSNNLSNTVSVSGHLDRKGHMLTSSQEHSPGKDTMVGKSLGPESLALVEQRQGSNASSDQKQSIIRKSAARADGSVVDSSGNVQIPLDDKEQISFSPAKTDLVEQSSEEHPGQLVKRASPFRLLQDYASEGCSDDEAHDEDDVPSTAILATDVHSRSDDKNTGDNFGADLGPKRVLASDMECNPLSESHRCQDFSFKSQDITLEVDVTSVTGKSKFVNVYDDQRLVEDSVSHGPLNKESASTDANVEASVCKKDAMSVSTKMKVDKFGRLIREGASDSDSDGSPHYTGRRGKRDRSRSRSRSPHDRKRRRRSPWGRKGRRGRSRSFSPRRRSSRSRSPLHRDEYPGDKMRRDKGLLPECFDFRRGKCYRGASCRYLHHEEKHERSRPNRIKQSLQELARSSRRSDLNEKNENAPQQKTSRWHDEGRVQVPKPTEDMPGVEKKILSEPATRPSDVGHLEPDILQSPVADPGRHHVIPTSVGKLEQEQSQGHYTDQVFLNLDQKHGKMDKSSESSPMETSVAIPNQIPGDKPQLNKGSIIDLHTTLTNMNKPENIPFQSIASHQSNVPAANNTFHFPPSSCPLPLPEMAAPYAQQVSSASNSASVENYPAYQASISYPHSQFPIPSNPTWNSLPPPPALSHLSHPSPNDMVGTSSTHGQYNDRPVHFQQNMLHPRNQFLARTPTDPYITEIPAGSHVGQNQIYPSLPEPVQPSHPMDELQPRTFPTSQQISKLHGGADVVGKDCLTGRPLLSSYPLHSYMADSLHSQALPFSRGSRESPSKRIPPADSVSSLLDDDGKVISTMSRYTSGLFDRDQPSQFADFGGSRISSHYNPYASTFEQLSSKHSSNIITPEKDRLYGSHFGAAYSFRHVPGGGRAVSLCSNTISPQNTVQGAQGTLPGPMGDQYDPLYDSIEPSSNSVKKSGHNFEATDESDIMVRMSGSNKPLDVEENNKQKGEAIALTASIENEEYGETADAEVGTVEDGSPSEPNNAEDTAAGEVEIDQVKAPGKNKKNKESRSMKLFKVALANFVKEVLKPSWRQGNMSKEAFKTIVKKTVDKVSGAMKSHQIPKSQAKINHYIDSSQRKLTKLVMGYVDKYVKV